MTRRAGKRAEVGPLETRLWWITVGVGGWFALGRLAALGDEKTQSELAPYLLVLLAIALLALWRVDVVWRLAWLARLPRVALGSLMNRWWRTTFDVSPAPLTMGSTQVWVASALTPEDRERVPRLTEALDLIGAVQPSRRARLDAIAPHLLVAPTLGAASYAPGANLLIVDPRTLRKPIEVIAGVLVHESNHARVGARGILHPMFHERYERMARRDALLFAECLYRAGDFAAAYRARSAAMRGVIRRESWGTRWKRIVDAVGRLQQPPARMRDADGR